jgi:hypothetical protein
MKNFIEGDCYDPSDYYVEDEREKEYHRHAYMDDERHDLFKVLDYIEKLEKESFEGWSDDAKKGYLTAVVSIKERINQLLKEK